MKANSVYNLLVLVLVIGVLGFIVSLLSFKALPAGWESSKAVLCNGQKSYLINSELYNFEKTRYTSSARVYKVFTSSGDQLRVVFDYFPSADSSDGFSYQVVISNAGSHSVDIGNFKVALSLPSAQVSLSSNDKDLTLGADTSEIFTGSSKSAIGHKQSWTISATGAGHCQFQITDIGPESAIASSKNAIKGVVVGLETGSLPVAPGFNSIGFSDWRTVKPFNDAGIKVLTFNREHKGRWSQIEMDGKSIFEPGVGYFLENSTSQTVNVQLDEPFKVPSNISSHSMRQGWNLLYNDSGSSILADNYKVTVGSSDFARRDFQSSQWTLGELIKNSLMSDKIFTLPKFQETPDFSRGIDIGTGRLEDRDIFWTYLFDEPDIEKFSTSNLDFLIKSDKDSYKSGEKIRMNLKVTNNSDKNYAVDGESQDDPCMYGFVVLKGGKTVYSSAPSGIASCPSWPEQTDLQPGSVIEYNQTWEVPKNIYGEVKIVGYFDQSRIFSKDRKSKQIVVNIESNE